MKSCFMDIRLESRLPCPSLFDCLTVNCLQSVGCLVLFSASTRFGVIII